jgi:hypothetical protein
MANLHNNLNSTSPDPNSTIPDSHSPHHSTATANGVGTGTTGNSTSIRHQPFHLSESMISINHSIAVKLTDTGFHTWKSAILPFINSYSLSRFLDASPPPSTITDNFGQVALNPTYITWHKQDQFLLGWLRSSVTESILSQVATTTNCHDF